MRFRLKKKIKDRKCRTDVCLFRLDNTCVLCMLRDGVIITLAVDEERNVGEGGDLGKKEKMDRGFED